MKRRGFLKALGGAAAVSVVGVPESHGVECYPMDSPLERLPLALQRQIMDNIYLASNPRMYGDQLAKGIKECRAGVELTSLSK